MTDTSEEAITQYRYQYARVNGSVAAARLVLIHQDGWFYFDSCPVWEIKDGQIVSSWKPVAMRRTKLMQMTETLRRRSDYDGGVLAGVQAGVKAAAKSIENYGRDYHGSEIAEAILKNVDAYKVSKGIKS